MDFFSPRSSLRKTESRLGKELQKKLLSRASKTLLFSPPFSSSKFFRSGLRILVINQLKDEDRKSVSRMTRRMTRRMPRRMKSLIPFFCLLVLMMISCHTCSSSHHHARHRHLPHDEGNSVVQSSVNTSVGCIRCSLQGEARDRRLAEIKHEILHKLGLKSAPNVTMREVPRLPPVNSILGSYGLTTPEDESVQNEDESDDFGGERVTRGMTTSDGMLSDKPSDQSTNDYYEDFLINSEKSISFSRSRKLLYLAFISLFYSHISLTFSFKFL